MNDEINDALYRVKEFLAAHKANAYTNDNIVGIVGMAGHELLRSSDVQILFDATIEGL